MCQSLIKYQSPLVCPLVGIIEKTTEPPPTAPSTTAGPAAEPTKAPENNTAGSGEADKVKTPDSEVPVKSGGMGAFGVISIILTVGIVFVVVGMVLRNPDHRTRVMSLFRRKNVTVAYSRVSTSCYHAFRLMLR